MSLSTFTPPQKRPTWRRLYDLAQRPLPHLRELLGAVADERQAGLQMQAAGLRLDARRQQVTPEVLDALYALADESGVLAHSEAQRRGVFINTTEGRAALHMALRGAGLGSAPWGGEVSGLVAHELERFLATAERLRSGSWCGFKGENITDVVNLGIGGSDLGPRMAVQALGAYCDNKVRVHFVSNPDAWALYAVLRDLNPGKTVFVVQSKSFTTQETLALLASARHWLEQDGCPLGKQALHLIAVTASSRLAAEHGFLPEQTHYIWDWVGGRYSVWSAIGLPLAVAIGADNFRSFLAGGRAMDEHFWAAPVRQNLPLLMALLGVWNRNFLGCPSQLVAPYAARMAQLVPFLQQLEMESNGKSSHVDGEPAQIGTGAIVWGGLGIEGQHAYFQLLHQGQHRVPIDFIGVETDDCPLPRAAEHHRLHVINMNAQAQALALGRDRLTTEKELLAMGLSAEQASRLAPHRCYPGNVPSSSLWLPALTPHSLGALVALYEHKVFCQASIWGINAFDQWGVELGKTMAGSMTF